MPPLNTSFYLFFARQKISRTFEDTCSCCKTVFLVSNICTKNERQSALGGLVLRSGFLGVARAGGQISGGQVEEDKTNPAENSCSQLRWHSSQHEVSNHKSPRPIFLSKLLWFSGAGWLPSSSSSPPPSSSSSPSAPLLPSPVMRLSALPSYPNACFCRYFLQTCHGLFYHPCPTSRANATSSQTAPAASSASSAWTTSTRSAAPASTCAPSPTSPSTSSPGCRTGKHWRAAYLLSSRYVSKNHKEKPPALFFYLFRH